MRYNKRAMDTFLKTTKNVYAQAKHHWLTLSFILGFIFDNLLLHRIDQARTNTVLSFYTVLTMLSTLLLYAGISERYGDRFNLFLKQYAPIVMQFAFGGVLSGMLIFYSRSGTITDSWPFLFIIIFVIYGNETIKNRGQRLVYNLSIFFVGLFAYSALIVPVIVGKIGALVFVGSGFVALFIMYWFFIALTKIVPNFIELQRRHVVFSIGIIYVLFNFFYFANIIPPVPLALKDIGIFHNVVHAKDGTYALTYENPTWWQFFNSTNPTFHVSAGEPIYCFASVFAPTQLETDIYERWQYYDEVKGAWQEYGRYSYPITGGRGEGFRGYTEITNHQNGKWRCIVETARGQSLGKVSFTVSSGVKEGLVTKIE